MANDPGLLRLDLEVLDGCVDVDCLLEVAGLDDDLEDFVCLSLVDLLEDDLEALEGRAADVDAVDDVWLEGGDLVADPGAVSLDAVAIVDADEVGCTTIVAIEHLDRRHGFLVS